MTGHRLYQTGMVLKCAPGLGRGLLATWLDDPTMPLIEGKEQGGMVRSTGMGRRRLFTKDTILQIAITWKLRGLGIRLRDALRAGRTFVELIARSGGCDEYAVLIVEAGGRVTIDSPRDGLSLGLPFADGAAVAILRAGKVYRATMLALDDDRKARAEHQAAADESRKMAAALRARRAREAPDYESRKMAAALRARRAREAAAAEGRLKRNLDPVAAAEAGVWAAEEYLAAIEKIPGVTRPPLTEARARLEDARRRLEVARNAATAATEGGR